MSNTKSPRIILITKKFEKAKFIAKTLAEVSMNCILVEQNSAKAYFQVVPSASSLPPKRLEALREIASGLAFLWEEKNKTTEVAA